jgi:hypothetical protein
LTAARTTGLTRRQFLAGVCGGATVLAGCSSRADPEETTALDDQSKPENSDWTEVESPTEMTLFGAVAVQRGPLAVGEGGRVVRRTGGEWEVELASGPTGEYNGLSGVDATSNGRRAWFCGDSGVLGRYDVKSGELLDRSAPEGKTSSWEDVAVAGLAGEEWLYLVNGSGELLQGRHSGGQTEWRDVVKPGSGSSALAVEFLNRGTGYVCDTSGNVFQTVNAGGEWRRIGIDGAGVNFHDVAPRGANDVTIGGGNGGIFQYDGFSWSSRSTGGGDVHAVARGKHDGLAADASGDVFEFTRQGWQPAGSPTDAPLHDVVLGGVDLPDVAVGAGGTILERSR